MKNVVILSEHSESKDLRISFSANRKPVRRSFDSGLRRFAQDDNIVLLFAANE